MFIAHDTTKHVPAHVEHVICTVVGNLVAAFISSSIEMPLVLSDTRTTKGDKQQNTMAR